MSWRGPEQTENAVENEVPLVIVTLHLLESSQHKDKRNQYGYIYLYTRIQHKLSPWSAIGLPRFSPGPNWLCETSLRAHHLSALYFISPIFQMGIIVLALPTSQDCWKGQMRKCMWKLFEKLKVLPNCKGINSRGRRGGSGLFAGNGELARRVGNFWAEVWRRLQRHIAFYSNTEVTTTRGHSTKPEGISPGM